MPTNAMDDSQEKAKNTWKTIFIIMEDLSKITHKNNRDFPNLQQMKLPHHSSFRELSRGFWTPFEHERSRRPITRNYPQFAETVYAALSKHLPSAVSSDEYWMAHAKVPYDGLSDYPQLFNKMHNLYAASLFFIFNKENKNISNEINCNWYYKKLLSIYEDFNRYLHHWRRIDTTIADMKKEFSHRLCPFKWLMDSIANGCPGDTIFSGALTKESIE